MNNKKNIYSPYIKVTNQLTYNSFANKLTSMQGARI